MSKKLKVDIRVPSELFGGEYYIIHVDVTNITNQTIDGILVNPHLLPGNLIYEQTVDKEINDLKKQKQQIIGEMQLQVRMARIMTSRERRNFIDRFFIDLSVDLATLFGLPETAFFRQAFWAKEAIRIDEWNDIERLEKEIIAPLDDKYILKKMFSLDKQKLYDIQERINGQLKDQNQTNYVKDTYSIQPGNTVTFNYKAKASPLLRSKTYSLQFNISYDENDDTKSTFSSYQTATFHPSLFAIPLGSFTGAIAGFIIRAGLTGLPQSPWLNLVGSTVLGVVFALLTARTPNSQKVITTEDFIGGFILGALVGIFSEAILDKVKTLVTKI